MEKKPCFDKNSPKKIWEFKCTHYTDKGDFNPKSYKWEDRHIFIIENYVKN